MVCLIIRFTVSRVIFTFWSVAKMLEPSPIIFMFSAAMNMVILDKLQDAIDKEESLTSSMTGSMGQQKIEVNPLLGQYYKAQQVLMDQFTLLGLTMKGKKNNGGGDEQDDPMASLYTEAKM